MIVPPKKSLPTGVHVSVKHRYRTFDRSHQDRCQSSTKQYRSKSVVHPSSTKRISFLNESLRVTKEPIKVQKTGPTKSSHRVSIVRRSNLSLPETIHLEKHEKAPQQVHPVPETTEATPSLKDESLSNVVVSSPIRPSIIDDRSQTFEDQQKYRDSTSKIQEQKEGKQRKKRLVGCFYPYWIVCLLLCLLTLIIIGGAIAAIVMSLSNKTAVTGISSSASTLTIILSTVTSSTITTSTITTSSTTTFTTTTSTTTTSTTTTSTTTTSTTTTSTTTTTVTYIVRTDNMIFNGDGESGPCASGSNVTSPTGWNTNGTITQIYYNNSANAGHSLNIPGPSDRGNCYFFGQLTTSTSMWQTVNLTNYADPSMIDAQLVRYNLSAWLGGYASQDDNTVISVVFFDENSQVILSGISIGPVLAADRSNQTSLLFRQTNGVVPIGARTAKLTVKMTRVVAPNCNSDADNIALALYS